MTVTYDNQNIFAKILRGETPNETVYENDYVLAFHDIAKQRKEHVLIIPRKAYVSIHDFGQKASDAEIAALIRSVPKIAEKLSIAEDGYRVIANIGSHGGQEVPHLHLHILGGEPVGKMVS